MVNYMLHNNNWELKYLQKLWTVLVDRFDRLKPRKELW